MLEKRLLTVSEFKKKIFSLGYDEPIFRKSALRIRDGGGVFESIFQRGQFDTILEIGTSRGLTAAYMAHFAKRVITIDLEETSHIDRQSLWDNLNLKNIKLKLVKDNEEKKKFIKRVKFNFAFIDGGKEDVADDFALVKKCGFVLFHDYDDRGQPALNVVYDFVNSLPKAQVKPMDIFALWIK